MMRHRLTLLALAAAIVGGCAANPASYPGWTPSTNSPTAMPRSASPAIPEATAPATQLPSPQPSTFAPTGTTETARVVRVVDGDTIVVDRGLGDERLRYIGMDTPETVKPASPVEWMGREASAANKTLVEGQTVVLEKDVSDVDQFGRLLRHVWLNRPTGWLLVDLELVRTGYARASTYPPDVKYADLYLAAQVDAREHDRGLWGSGPIDFTEPSDGAVLATKTIVVRGTAAPGARVVRDIPAGLDQSTRAAADGTWSMEVTLKRGLNAVRFRIEDEKATTRTLRLVYQP
jgi:micrococcal nuclease